VILGHGSTLPITLDFLLTLTAAVRRGAPSRFLVGDMPFLSYQVNDDEAIRNAGRFMAEAGCDCVKIEADARLIGTVERITAASIPVMVHLGLRPQAVHQLGGYKAQARDSVSAQKLMDEARRMEDAGASALLLEAVPAEPARRIAESTDLPVIGCGAGPHCDGQVLVVQDMLGLTQGRLPRFVKRYADVRSVILEIVGTYIDDVVARRFPSEAHTYTLEGPSRGNRRETSKPAASGLVQPGLTD
jgi:3-methyl-2-oxobutanoate hydroxymethyltransferase